MNQNPEQIARDQIDDQLVASGWIVQSAKQKNIAAGIGVAIREYPTDTGPLKVDTSCIMPHSDICKKEVANAFWSALRLNT